MGRKSYDDKRDEIISAKLVSAEEGMALSKEEINEKWKTLNPEDKKVNTSSKKLTLSEIEERARQRELLQTKLEELRSKADSMAKLPFVFGKLFTSKENQWVWEPDPAELEALSFFIRWGAEYVLTILNPAIVCAGGLALTLAGCITSRMQLISTINAQNELLKKSLEKDKTDGKKVE